MTEDQIIEKIVADWKYDDCESYVPNNFPFTENSGTVAEELLENLTFFSYFLDESLVGQIVSETNRYATQVITNMEEGNKVIPASLVKCWVNTNVTEIYKFVAINFLMEHI